MSLTTRVRTAMSDLELVDDGALLTLYIDGVESSAIDPRDRTYLEFEYMQHIRIAADVSFGPDAPLRALHLGGAGCALARALDAQRPGSRQLAIEIDPELAQLARKWFDLPPSPRLRIRSQDARETLETNKGSWHLIVRDAFAKGRIPRHLSTVEAHRLASQLLADDGIYCLNVAGEAGLAPVYRESRALLESFEHIAAISDPAIRRGRRLGNVVLVASHSPLPFADIDRQVRKLALPTIAIKHAELAKAAASAPLIRDIDVGYTPSSR